MLAATGPCQRGSVPLQLARAEQREGVWFVGLNDAGRIEARALSDVVQPRRRPHSGQNARTANFATAGFERK